jgi:hypothetical protein
LVHRLGEGEQDAGPQTDHCRLPDARLHRNGVGGLEANTANVAGPRTPRQRVDRPANVNSGLSSARTNQIGVLRGFVPAYSQNDLAGSRQRFCRPSHPRQWGPF